MTYRTGVSDRRSARARAIVAACLLAGCVDTVEVDAQETVLDLTTLPIVEFDPGRGVIPLPNDLLLDRETGRVRVPASCGEEPDSPAARLRGALNQLDGFATSRASLVATSNVALDPDSLAERVFVLRLAERGRALLPPEPVEIDVALGTSERLSPDCAESREVHSLLIRPRVPLLESSTYGVVLLAGIQSEDGDPLEPSPTWALVRQGEPPVVFADEASGVGLITNDTPFDPASRDGLASLQGLSRLWRGHAPLLQAWDALGPVLTGEPVERDGVLLAWGFTTQTLSEPFDPRVLGTPANALESSSTELFVPAPLAGEGGPLSIEQFFASALPDVPCSALGCDAIGWIYAASPVSQAPSFTAPSFLENDDCAEPPGVASGAFDDALKPSLVCERSIPLLVVLPRSAPSAGGYPVIVFGHGLGRSKEDLLALAGSFAQAGFASVAFDAVDHGGRALQLSTEAALGCDGPGADKPCSASFGPTCAPQCFAPLLSADLARTRDHLRQTLLDQKQLERVLGACAEDSGCRQLGLNPERVAYVGHGLGALLGPVGVATSSTLGAAVLNEPAGDWVSVLTDTATDAIRCPLVDSLIAAGVLEGAPWSGGAEPDALCLGDEWKQDPGFLQFASTARWLLDPVDPVNYAKSFADGDAPPTLLGEIDADPVIPNSATAELARLIGLNAATAAVAASATPEPSPAALEPGNVWIRYESLPAEPESAFPGIAFGPGSLLSPAPAATGMGDAAGLLGTARLRADTLGYLGSRLP
jgi:hypothetical protein